MNSTLTTDSASSSTQSTSDRRAAGAPPKRKGIRPLHAFLAAVVGPTVLTLLYLLVFAQPTYESDIHLIVRENNDNTNAITGLADLFNGGTHISVEDSYILSDFLHSDRFVRLAEERLGLKAHYQSPRFDIFRRLKKDPLAEEFRDYVFNRIVINIASDSNIVTIQARAFTPEKAKEIADFIVEESEKAINTLNARMADSRLELAKTELSHRQAALLEKRQQLLKFQTEHGMLNPTNEAGSQLSTLASIDNRRVEKETELRTKEKFLQPDSFEIKRLRQEIQALDEQRRQETGLLVSPGNSSMAQTLQAYEALKLEADFAQQAYASAFSLVESSTLEAGRQEKFLLLVDPPHLPEDIIFPRPILGCLVVLVGATILFGIGRLIVATIRDHSI